MIYQEDMIGMTTKTPLEKVLGKIDKKFKHMENVIGTLTNKIKMLEETIDRAAWNTSASAIEEMQLMLEYQIVGGMADVHLSFMNMLQREAEMGMEYAKKLKEEDKEEEAEQILAEAANKLHGSRKFAILYDNDGRVITKMDEKMRPWLVKKYPDLVKAPQEPTEMRCQVCGKPCSMIADEKPVCRNHFTQVMKLAEKADTSETLEEMKKKRLEELEKNDSEGSSKQVPEEPPREDPGEIEEGDPGQPPDGHAC
jgi:hypothetical protein